MSRLSESCRNPWNNSCRNSDIELYIYYKNKMLPICRHCWKQIADRDHEW